MYKILKWEINKEAEMIKKITQYLNIYGGGYEKFTTAGTHTFVVPFCVKFDKIFRHKMVEVIIC